MAKIDLTFLNPFAKYFKQGQPEQTSVNDEVTEDNAQGFSTEDEALYKSIYNYNTKSFQNAHNVYVAPLNFFDQFKTKKEKIQKYRQMEIYPEISEAIDMICDDVIISDTKGDIVHLEFKKDLPARQKKLLKKEFKYIVNDVLKAETRMWDFFRKYLVEGEQFLEIVLDDTKKNVVGVKPLASHVTFPLYKGNQIVGYMQHNANENQTDAKDIMYPKEQISYVHWGRFGDNKTDVRGYLDPAKVTYNQLKALEDAIVVYRLVRAPERRVWNVEVGRMPKGKAEEYLNNLIHKQKKQTNYNPETGMVDSSKSVQSMTEDYYFAKNEGQGTSVDTLQAGQSLGELTDVEYFLKKLYKVLKLPKNRFEDATAQYNSGMSIEREEIRFGKFIDRIQTRYKKHVLDVFIQQLRVKKYKDKFINRAIYDVKFNKSNFFNDYKEQELNNSKIDLWGNISSYVIGVDNPEGTFSEEFAFKDICLFSDEDWEKNKRLRAKELAAIEDETPDELFDPRGYDDPGIVMQQQAIAQNQGKENVELIKKGEETKDITKPSDAPSKGVGGDDKAPKPKSDDKKDEDKDE